MADRTLQSETLYRRKPSGRYYPAAERIPEEPMSWPPGDYLVHVEPNRCNRRPVNPSQAASFGVSVYCKPNLTVLKEYPTPV